jgi:TrmH family RNA methyltransferase
VTNSPLNNIVVVLVEPQNVVNIAGVIRAMMNMGVRTLRLVRPGEFDPWRIGGIAHRSEDITEATEIFDSPEAALADCEYVMGTSARPRTAQRNYVRPRPAASGIIERASLGRAAIVFGREDRGLSNEVLDLCHAVAIIPTDPDYSSLNLAQACLLLLYELFLAAEEGPDTLPRGRRSTRAASTAEMEEMYAALEAGLGRIEFFKAREPASILRTLRTLLGRAEPELREARLVQAIGFEIGNYLDRTSRDDAAFEANQDPERDSS